MARNFPKEESEMTSRPNFPPKPTAGRFARTRPAPIDAYVPGDALPVPDVIEKDSESVWALWSNAVNGSPDKETDAHAATQLMGLEELPKAGKD